jgi:CheY-like chemotaxis protein
MTPALLGLARALRAGSSLPRLPRVLVVDRSGLVRHRACAELARLGCTTRSVPTPLDAIQELERGGVDGVVIGPTLTQTCAGELAAFIAESYPDLPVVVLSVGPRDRPCVRDRPPGLLAALGGDGGLALAA